MIIGVSTLLQLSLSNVDLAFVSAMPPLPLSEANKKTCKLGENSMKKVVEVLVYTAIKLIKKNPCLINMGSNFQYKWRRKKIGPILHVGVN